MERFLEVFEGPGDLLLFQELELLRVEHHVGEDGVEVVVEVQTRHLLVVRKVDVLQHLEHEP